MSHSPISVSHFTIQVPLSYIYLSLILTSRPILLCCMSFDSTLFYNSPLHTKFSHDHMPLHCLIFILCHWIIQYLAPVVKHQFQLHTNLAVDKDDLLQNTVLSSTYYSERIDRDANKHCKHCHCSIPADVIYDCISYWGWVHYRLEELCPRGIWPPPSSLPHNIPFCVTHDSVARLKH